MAGINKTLYGSKEEPVKTMTAQEVMDALHIKDRRTLSKLFKNGLPYIRIGKEYLVSVKAYNKWLVDNTVIKG